MNATLIFQLPEDLQELSDALNGDAFRGALLQVRDVLAHRLQNHRSPMEVEGLTRALEEIENACSDFELTLEPTVSIPRKPLANDAQFTAAVGGEGI